jgi:hypothetical protein
MTWRLFAKISVITCSVTGVSEEEAIGNCFLQAVEVFPAPFVTKAWTFEAVSEAFKRKIEQLGLEKVWSAEILKISQPNSQKVKSNVGELWTTNQTSVTKPSRNLQGNYSE